MFLISKIKPNFHSVLTNRNQNPVFLSPEPINTYQCWVVLTRTLDSQTSITFGDKRPGCWESITLFKFFLRIRSVLWENQNLILKVVSKVKLSISMYLSLNTFQYFFHFLTKLMIFVSLDAKLKCYKCWAWEVKQQCKKNIGRGWMTFCFNFFEKIVLDLCLIPASYFSHI